MARISGSIPNFINGVSQQAMALRMASQGDLQLNAYSTVVDGLIKRPPIKRIARLGGDFIAKPIHTHNINRDTNERYETVWSPDGIRVFTLDGGERQVNYSGGLQYLQYSGVLEQPPYRTATIGDYTYLTNTQRVVGMDTNIVEPAQASEALIYVMAGNYGKDYSIRIDGVEVARYSTPDGTSGAQSPGVDTAYISRRMATGETKDLGMTVNDKVAWAYKATDKSLESSGINAAGGWTVSAGKGTLYIRRNDGAPFTVTTEDGYNGHAMKAIQYETQDFSDLPAYGWVGFACKVKGSVTTAYDDYYVRFKASVEGGSGITGGQWVECAKPGSRLAFAAETMPHALVREADGTFTFGPVDWETRRCGDEVTSPSPSFVGQSISDIFWFKNRLGFLSGENTIMGRAGGPFDFWKSTATTSVDDDPIDVASSETDVSILRSAVGFADRLILFADQSQAMLAGNDTLTYKTVNIKPSTQYSMSSRCRPVVNGDNVYFPVKRGQYSMVREYTIDPASDLGKAEDITGNVPQYLRGDIVRMRASTHDDVLVVQTDKENGLGVYKYFYQDRTKVQSSWSKWTFPGVNRILDFWFIGSILYLLTHRTNGETWLETMDVQPGGVDDNMGFIVNLDHRWMIDAASVGATYNYQTDRTYIPVDITGNDYTLVSAPSELMEPGLLLHPEDITPVGFNLVGDLRQLSIFVGLDYEMRYRLSTIYIRETGTSGVPIVRTEGRLQLVKLLVQYSQTAYLRCEVSLQGMPKRSYATNGRVMGDPNNRADFIPVSDGTLEVPLLSKNDRLIIELVNDSYLPSSILAAEWLANYVAKSKRV